MHQRWGLIFSHTYDFLFVKGKNRPWGFWIRRWMNRFIGELYTLKYFEERVLPIQGRKYRVEIRDVTNHVGTYIGANFDVWVVFPSIPFRHGPPQQQ